jgi:uncharacterized protein YjbI with pentapeptide repeats
VENRSARNANLKLASLARSGLTGAKPAGADVTDAYLYRTIIVGVDLSAVKELQQDQLDIACRESKDQASRRAERWPCEE